MAESESQPEEDFDNLFANAKSNVDALQHQRNWISGDKPNLSGNIPNLYGD